MGKLEELEKLQQLKENGVIIEDEFNSEKAKILSGESDVGNNDNNNLEIKGDFLLAQSKILLQLEEGEKVIYQYEAVTLIGAGSTVVNGLLILTNRRILFNKKNSGKKFGGTGLFGLDIAIKRHLINKNIKCLVLFKTIL